MKKSLILVGLLSIGYVHAQQNDPYDGKVGINTETPTATLNVKSKTGKTTDNTKNFELLNAQNRVLMRVWDSRKASIGTEADTDDYLNIRNLFFFNWEKRAFGTGISAATVGGWARGYHFLTQDNSTNFGGFGAYGIPNSLKYFYVGQIPTSGTPIATFTYDTKNVGIGIISPLHKLHIKEDTDNDPLKIEGLKSSTVDTEDILVVSTSGVVKKISRASLGSTLPETEWVYDDATKRINLRRSGQTQNFTNEIYYTKEGQSVNAKGLSVDDVKSTAAKNIISMPSEDLLTRTSGSSTFKVLNSNQLNISSGDNTNNFRLNENLLSVDNNDDYRAFYNDNSFTTLKGSGNINTTIAKWGQLNVEGTRNITGYGTAILGSTAITSSGTIKDMYGMYNRNFYSSAVGAKVTTSAAGFFYKAHVANDASLITKDVGIKIDLRNGSKNTGTGEYMAGLYNEIMVTGKTKYPNVYGIYTSVNINKATATAPDNHYGLYINNVEGGLKTNYAIHTGAGQVRLGDLKGVGDRAVYVDANGVLKAGAAGSGLGTTGLWKREGDEVKLAVLSDGTDRTQENTVAINDKGEIYATSLKGKNGASIFPDYVFEKYYTGTSSVKADYTFKSLSQVEDFVKTNGHLPGYKSAEAIKAQGYIDVMETQVANVEKIEELYLHTIEQEKALKEKDAKIKSLEERLERLEKLIK